MVVVELVILGGLCLASAVVGWWLDPQSGTARALNNTKTQVLLGSVGAILLSCGFAGDRAVAILLPKPEGPADKFDRRVAAPVTAYELRDFLSKREGKEVELDVTIDEAMLAGNCIASQCFRLNETPDSAVVALELKPGAPAIIDHRIKGRFQVVDWEKDASGKRQFCSLRYVGD